MTLPTATIFSAIDAETVDLITAIDLIDVVLMGMRGDKESALDAQDKMLYLTRGLGDKVRNVRALAERAREASA